MSSDNRGIGTGSCSAGSNTQGCSPGPEGAEAAIARNMGRVRHKIIVMSGKGGVGKSTVAVNLAASLVAAGKRVGLLDADVHGPSVPIMLGLAGDTLRGSPEGILPVTTASGMKVISVSFFLENPAEPTVWRGPMKAGVIKQFLQEVAWGDLDYLIVDCPPGTGDEPLSVIQLMDDPSGAVIVTTPQEVALEAVKKSISFCRLLELPVLGIVQNMNGFTCPHCGESSNPFKNGGGEELAEVLGIPLLGSIPLTGEIAPSGDNGTPVSLAVDSAVGNIFHEIASFLDADLETTPTVDQ
jgi:ATP-binding protein involved in chromosome partitioning